MSKRNCELVMPSSQRCYVSNWGTHPLIAGCKRVPRRVRYVGFNKNPLTYTSRIYGHESSGILLPLTYTNSSKTWGNFRDPLTQHSKSSLTPTVTRKLTSISRGSWPQSIYIWYWYIISVNLNDTFSTYSVESIIHSDFTLVSFPEHAHWRRRFAA
jgi:hypothetical protein